MCSVEHERDKKHPDLIELPEQTDEPNRPFQKAFGALCRRITAHLERGHRD
jgi:hypothetical protein